jgi:hypothetical protein
MAATKTAVQTAMLWYMRTRRAPVVCSADPALWVRVPCVLDRKSVVIKRVPNVDADTADKASGAYRPHLTEQL